MKIFLAFLLASASCFAQGPTLPFGAVTNSLGPTYTDTFARANGGLGTNWTTVTGSDCDPAIVSDFVMASTAPCTHSLGAYSAGTFHNNQYTTSIVGTESSISFQSLVVRSGSGRCYNDGYTGYSTSWALGVLNPTPTDFGAVAPTNSAPVVGNTLGLYVAGTGPVFFWSMLDSGSGLTINATAVDSTYNFNGGVPGVGVVEQNSVPTATTGTWTGGSLPSFSSVPADNFTRADAGWLGVNWWFNWGSDEGGGWVLTGNKAVPALASLGSWAGAIWTTPFGPNQSSKITVGGGTWIGPLVRDTPINGGLDNLYAALENGGNIDLYVRVAGSWTLLGQWAHTQAPGETLELDASGTSTVTLTILINGTVFQTFSDSTYHIAGNYAGFTALGSGISVSNWIGATLP
jgi:hypothetical protein